MTNNEKPEKSSSLDTAVDFLKKDGGYDVAAAAMLFAQGVPIPPSIVKRLRVGIGRLIDGSFDVLAGSLSRKNARAEFEEKIQQAVVTKIAQSGSTELAQSSPAVTTAVAMSMLNDYGLKFDNKAATAQFALENLKKEPPLHDESPTSEISVDWLNYFSDIAGQKSDPEMQQLMGRILAGEIRKPGSFSPLTISVLSTLSIPVAKKFELLCSVSVEMQGMSIILTDIFPNFLSKGIPEIGFTYVDLLALRSHQLLASESGSNWPLSKGSVSFLSSCGMNFMLRPTGVAAEQIIAAALFTQVGSEMRRLVFPNAAPWFHEKLSAYYSQPNWQLEFLAQ